jgi:hypothetical protein
MLRFIELKSGFSDNGPAWIGRVQLSRSGRTVYFNGKAFNRGKVIAGNHFDIETGEEYWISGVKKNGLDRHWAGSGKITIESAAVDEYLKLMGLRELDSSKFVVSEKIEPPDPAKFHAMQNEGL